MASPSKKAPSPQPAEGSDGANGADEKPRLTEAEKKQNHIASGTIHALEARPVMGLD
jgi:hypothetical protein